LGEFSARRRGIQTDQKEHTVRERFYDLEPGSRQLHREEGDCVLRSVGEVTAQLQPILLIRLSTGGQDEPVNHSGFSLDYLLKLSCFYLLDLSYHDCHPMTFNERVT
ncbi:hypothetical protein XENOCAPTIV_021839, partial [Xenoophorus captivus]